ncbi:MAG TPA: vitamin K epoxide reductase family protein [Ktedonobacteraceae bacterium]|nr:vitamin K epoxide reductase family protein [Ktedonobacteraceae bacterium]
MKSIRRPIAQPCLLILSLIGIGIAIYLTTVHYENVPLICSASGFVDCAHVLSSSYSVVPSTTIPITVPGLVWCVISAVLAIIGLRFQLVPRWLRIAQFVLSLSGLLVVLYLVYVEIVRLHTICAWCTGLHVVILVMFLITLVQLQAPQSNTDSTLLRSSSRVR